MKASSCLASLCLMLSSVTASAQQSPSCPQLPPASGLQWNQLAGADYLACKAMDGEGRQVLGLMLTTRNPKITLTRSLRAEKGVVDAEEMHWYKLDLGGRELPQMESRRLTVVELQDDHYAQIWIDANTSEELASMQSLVQAMDLKPASLALGR